MRAWVGVAIISASVGCVRFSSLGGIRRRVARIETRSAGHTTQEVRGRLVERKSREPIRDYTGIAIAECAGVPHVREASMDENGRFELHELPTGRCNILVLFGTGEYARRLTLQPGEHVELRIVVPPSEMPRFYRN